jgi:hypothetical protein
VWPWCSNGSSYQSQYILTVIQPHRVLTTVDIVWSRYYTTKYTHRQCTQHSYDRTSPHVERMWTVIAQGTTCCYWPNTDLKKIRQATERLQMNKHKALGELFRGTSPMFICINIGGLISTLRGNQGGRSPATGGQSYEKACLSHNNVRCSAAHTHNLCTVPT